MSRPTCPGCGEPCADGKTTCGKVTCGLLELDGYEYRGAKLDLFAPPDLMSGAALRDLESASTSASSSSSSSDGAGSASSSSSKPRPPMVRVTSAAGDPPPCPICSKLDARELDALPREASNLRCRVCSRAYCVRQEIRTRHAALEAEALETAGHDPAELFPVELVVENRSDRPESFSVWGFRGAPLWYGTPRAFPGVLVTKPPPWLALIISATAAALGRTAGGPAAAFTLDTGARLFLPLLARRQWRHPDGWVRGGGFLELVAVDPDSKLELVAVLQWQFPVPRAHDGAPLEYLAPGTSTRLEAFARFAQEGGGR